jgi:hypothetical protein
LIKSNEWSYDHAFHVEIDAVMQARQIRKEEREQNGVDAWR